MIAIIDYDAGNLKSVEKALAHIGEESVITREFQTILNADKVILPRIRPTRSSSTRQPSARSQATSS